MIRIIIVDDEILSRVGIQSFFDEEADVEVVGTFGMASEAIKFLRKNKVDIVITDIEMADINSLEFIQIIREEDLANGVIIVSCHSDFSYAQEAIAKGTNSYVLKHNISTGLRFDLVNISSSLPTTYNKYLFFSLLYFIWKSIVFISIGFHLNTSQDCPE